jgi:hypothetical protein
MIANDQALVRYGGVEMLVPQGARPHVVTADLGTP